MDIIPIQASSVPCERVFSSGKETMAPRRRRIKPALMEKLQMLKFSIRKDTQACLNFTEGLSWATELNQLEELQKNFTPNDVYSYQKCLGVEDDDGDENWEDLEDDENEDLEKSDASDESEEEEEEEEEVMYEAESL
jgi:hAT family C-terminal dimerisation region